MIPLIIHNEKRTDRWETLQQELKEQNITEYKIIPAVTSNHKSVINICNAHKNCVRYAIEQGWDKVLIFEDDIKFPAPGSFDRFLEIFKKLPEDWLIYLGGIYDGAVTPLDDEFATCMHFSGLHCYVINKAFFEEFLQADETINLDRWISGKRWKNQKAYLAYPMVAYQYDGFSDNIKRKTEYNSKIISRFKIWKLNV